MRRPVKPFVTEYKAAGRRPSAGLSEQSAPENEKSGPKLFDFMLKAEPEESYDAAMRAADALFSIPSANTPHDASQEGFRERPDGRRGDSAPLEKGGGRILRVLDETPSPEYEALEAERAPKRRGRKPGSKNKPKPIVTALLGPPHLQEPRGHAALHPASYQTSATIAVAPSMPAARRLSAVAATVALNNEATPSGVPPLGGRQDKRFHWVRDKLKPGENWKRRRLPRVCW